MLSISGIGSAGGAANYYGKDDYYVTGEADSPGLVWGGQGSEVAGLKGTSTVEQFRAVLNGSHPSFNGGEVGKGDDRHRPGWDLTLSAPKSYSVLALVGGDTRLIELERAAVKAAMTYAEEHFSVTRVRQGDGTVKEVRTGNFVYATTVHQTSRAGDPQLHSHNVLANKTFDRETDTWRALETSHLYKNFKTVGLVYQTALAAGAMRLGYDVVKDSREGTFEIAGISREQLDAFSKRHADIQDRIQAKERVVGRSLTPAEREVIVLDGRPRKLDHPRHELEGRWRQEAADVGLNLSPLIDQAKEKAMGLDVTPRTSGVADDALSRANESYRRLTGQDIPAHDPYAAPRSADHTRNHGARALSYAVRVLEQSKTVFSKHEILAQALRLAPAGVTHSHVLASAHALQDDRRLQQADRTVLDGVTTKRALSLEREVVRQIENGKGVVSPTFSLTAAPAALERAEADPSVGITLDASQRAAAMKMLTSPDRYFGVQGSAGVGKTTMLRAVKAAATKEEFIGLAAQHDAARVLETEAGIKSRTIESFLGSVDRLLERGGVALERAQTYYGTRTLLVDESSMQSNAQMGRLMTAMNAMRVRRAIFVGDERQLGSPEAGAPFRHALHEGLDHAVMDNIRRQKDPQILAAVKHLAKGEVSPAMRFVQPHVTAIGRDASETDYAKAVHAAWSAARSEGKDPRIIVPTNKLRGAVAVEIRKTLIDEGALGAGERHQALRSDRLATAEKHRAENYTEGQILVFHRGHKASGTKRDAHLTVTGRDLRNNIVIAHGPDGSKHHLDLTAIERSRHSYFEPFLAKSLEVRAGEQLVWDRLHQERDPRTGELTRDFKVGAKFTVESVQGDRWTIRDENDTRHTLHRDDPALKFVSYGYAETADRSQGKTYRDVIAVLGSNHGEAATASRLYVQMSRTAESFGLITNDVQTLVMRLNKQSGLNLIASQELASLVETAGKADVADLVKDGAEQALGASGDDQPTPDAAVDGPGKDEPGGRAGEAPEQNPDAPDQKLQGPDLKPEPEADKAPQEDPAKQRDIELGQAPAPSLQRGKEDHDFSL